MSKSEAISYKQQSPWGIRSSPVQSARAIVTGGSRVTSDKIRNNSFTTTPNKNARKGVFVWWDRGGLLILLSKTEVKTTEEIQPGTETVPPFALAVPIVVTATVVTFLTVIGLNDNSCRGDDRAVGT